MILSVVKLVQPANANLPMASLSVRHINKIMKFLKECGFENVRLYDLRHTAATVLARELTPKQVQAFLGHEDFQTTMNIYTHIETQGKINTSCTMDSIIKKAEFCSETCSES